MSTIGVGLSASQDHDSSVPPPSSRAFKIAEAFGLVIQNEVLLCLDGMRVRTVSHYLQLLLSKAHSSVSIALELRPVADLDQQQILDDEGVKEMHIKSTMLAASNTLRQAGQSGHWLYGMLSGLKDLFEADITNNNDRQILAQHWGDLNVETVIKTTGGSRGEPIALKAMDAVGRDMLDESVDDVKVVLKTTQGSMVSVNSLVLGKFINVQRQHDRNDHDRVEIWGALEEYENELRRMGRWQP
jgi:hypothetical protein